MPKATLVNWRAKREYVDRCLTCELPPICCDRCRIYNKDEYGFGQANDNAPRYEYRGEMRTIPEIAYLMGYHRSTLNKRIKKGGYEFAISDYKRYDKWLEAQQKANKDT